MLSPIHHAADAAGVATYRAEPYVMAADVHAAPDHLGRGGWTWYTGSAGWMYRLIVETLLGVSREGTTLKLAPRVPAGWSGFAIRYRYNGSVYHVRFSRGGGATASSIPLIDDGQEHVVELDLPKR
jgi:cellobiose phosphorylase